MSTYSDLIGGSAGSATTVYAALADLPLSNIVAGAQAYVSATNRLYLWSGAGWYNIALINTAPTITTGGDSSYTLASDGTATVVTLDANDPEGIPITWSYAVTTGSLGSTATVSQADNVFTITPSASVGGTFSLTFTASDGVNIATSASEFTLAFSAPSSIGESSALYSAGNTGNSHYVSGQNFLDGLAYDEQNFVYYNFICPSYVSGTTGTDIKCAIITANHVNHTMTGQNTTQTVLSGVAASSYVYAKYIGDGKTIVVYDAAGDSLYPTAVIVTNSNGTLSAGSPTRLRAAATNSNFYRASVDVTLDDSGNIFVYTTNTNFGLTGEVALISVSGTNITVESTASVPIPGIGRYIYPKARIFWDTPSSKLLIISPNGNVVSPMQMTAATATVSGTTLSAFSALSPSSNPIPRDRGVFYHAGLQKYVVVGFLVDDVRFSVASFDGSALTFTDGYLASSGPSGFWGYSTYNDEFDSVHSVVSSSVDGTVAVALRPKGNSMRSMWIVRGVLSSNGTLTESTRVQITITLANSTPKVFDMISNGSGGYIAASDLNGITNYVTGAVENN